MAGFPDELYACSEFQWDAGNSGKNREVHQVSQPECEQIFFNRPILVAPDREHSQQDCRYAALGRTGAGRRLTVIFTVREGLVRVISARDMSRPERRVYGQAEEVQ